MNLHFDDDFISDDASRTTDDSSLPPPPPPRPRANETSHVSNIGTRGGWIYFESRFDSWVSTVDGSSDGSNDDESSVESFHDNSIDLESPVIITDVGSGMEIQPRTGGITHSPRAADMVRKALQQQHHRLQNNHNKKMMSNKKKQQEKKLAVGGGGDTSCVDGTSNKSSSWLTPKTCFFLAVVTIIILCGVLGAVLVVASRGDGSNNNNVNDAMSFGDMTVGNSGPPIDDEYNGFDLNAGIGGIDYDGSNLIIEVGDEGYSNDEDDDGFIEEEGMEYSPSSFDEDTENSPNTPRPSMNPARNPTRRPTKASTSTADVPRAPVPRPTVSIPLPKPTYRPTVTKPAPTRHESRPSAPKPEPQPQPRPDTKKNEKLSPHNKYIVPKRYATDFDGHILVPERQRNTLYIFNGGKSPTDRQWSESNALWSLPLYPRHLWVRSNSINDIKRVIHKNKIHIAVCGSGGDAVALYDFETKAAVYWSNTCGSAPHDVEYLPFGGGYLAVANARGKDSTINLYDVSGPNNQECIRGSTIDHNGVHSLHWDAKQKLLWAWGSDTVGLIAYRVIFGANGAPRLVKDQEHQPDVVNFKVATGHGGSPVIANGRRYLLLAGNSGILRFDTESHEWNIERRAPNNEGVYSNPKGVSYNMKTAEIIMAKSNSRVYSTETGQRQILIADIYKARWWQHQAFSFDLDGANDSNSAVVPKPLPKPSRPKPHSFFEAGYLIGAYYFPRNNFLSGQQYLRSQLQPPQPPQLGEYSVDDSSVIARHLAWSREANINLFVTGWRGPNSKEDSVIRNSIMKHKDLPGTKIALLYETHTRIGLNGDTGLENIYTDVEFIAQTYFDDPNYLRIDGRPVIYLYLSRVLHRNLILEQVVTLMRQAAAENGGHDVYIVGDQSFGAAPRPGSFYYPFDLLDSVTSYDVYGDIGRGGYAGQDGVAEYNAKQKKWHDAAIAHNGCAFIPSVTPGFNDGPRHSPLSRQVNEGADFGSLFRRILDNALDLADSSDSRMVMITSWNGFHDDTQIEPVRVASATGRATGLYNQMQLEYQGYGKLYLNILRQTVLRKQKERQ